MSISPRARFDRSFPLACSASSACLAALWGLAALGAAAAAGPAAAANELRDIRIGDHTAQTHVVIEADAPFCAAVALSETPYRLTIDLPDLGGARPRPRAYGVVAGSAWSDQAPGRLQFDLKQPARVVEMLVVPPADGKGFRRVIKLEPVDARGFAQAQFQLGRQQSAQQTPGCGGVATSKVMAAPLLPPAAPLPPPVVVTTPPPSVSALPVAAIPSASAAPVVEKPILRSPAPAPVAAPPVIAAQPAAAAAPATAPPAPPLAAPKLAAVPAPSAPAGSRLPKDRKWTVVIDPGHGGDDPGAISANGDYEKDLTLEIAQVLRARMEATKRYRVILTRSDNEFVELRERTALGERSGAHLFISLHADSIGSRFVRGLSVYTLSDKASDAESEALAAKENRADLIVGVDHSRGGGDDALKALLWRYEFDGATAISRQYRKFLIDEMRKSRVETLPNPHRSAGFVVLKAPKVPSVLIEMGYLSNAADVKLMRNAGHQARFAQAVIRAADRFFACPEVTKWFAASEDESLVGRGISCAPSSLAMGAGSEQ